jgi:hypothetical protein
VSGEDFAAFYKLVCAAAVSAREALDATTVASSAKKWRELFGNKFPDGGDDDDGGESNGGGSGSGAVLGGFTPRTEPTVVTGRRFA